MGSVSRWLAAGAVIAASLGLVSCSSTPKEVAVIETDYGNIVIRFFPKDAPKTVANFLKLARAGFYDGTTFHRVIPKFMIQGGDPLSKDLDRADDGTGGPGYTLPAEIRRTHVRGSVAMARLSDRVNPQRRSSGSQFYICVEPQPMLDGQYTVFGQVIKGMAVVDSISNMPRDARDNPINQVYMRHVIVRPYQPGDESKDFE